ncbi:MAG: hypothetical protein JW838_07665 [Spirochaetes bacterium]|nr:hypothetical protein [Spirochaetota bacterium]
MTEETIKGDAMQTGIDALLDDLVEFIDYATFNKIINKLTDYAEILGEGKISGIINFNYRLNSDQTNKVIRALEEIQAISRIYNIALKGSKDLEVEYISNIFSEAENPEMISSYINLKNIIENRLTHQVQQYNVNMGKNNTTMAIPLNELRGHVKTFMDLSGTDATISTKAQHGIIAASLHDAYTTLFNKDEYWNDRTYMKFFFNEDDPARRKYLLLKKHERLSMRQIADRVKETLDRFHASFYHKMQLSRESSRTDSAPIVEQAPRYTRTEYFTDRMMMTPFGRQYGGLIEKTLERIFTRAMDEKTTALPEDSVKDMVMSLYQAFKLKTDLAKQPGELVDVAEYLLGQVYGIKTFAEKFLYFDRKETFSKFYSGQNQEEIEQFLNRLFAAYFETSFSGLFRIIKSLDMKKFACAFIIKRIYFREGENLTNFGFFFIRVIARTGGIKVQ